MTSTWNIVQMEAYPEYDGNTDVVFTVHWTLNATEDEYSGGVYGSSAVLLNEGGTFTPFADLTKEQVVGWVHAALGEEQVAAYEASVLAQIELQKNPTVVTPALPWGE